MPIQPLDEDERYTRLLFQAVQDLTKQLGTIQGDIKEDTALLLRNYREDTHRSMMSFYTRLVAMEDAINSDRASRVARQKTLDGQLEAIQHNQRGWIRFVMFAAICAIGIAIGIWVF